MLDALSKPSPAIDGVPDERSIAARQGDALVDAAQQVLGFGDLPDYGGARPHITVIVDLDVLHRGLRGAMLDYGQTLHPEISRMLACDACVVPVVLGGASQPLDRRARAGGTCARTSGMPSPSLAGTRCARPSSRRPPARRRAQ